MKTFASLFTGFGGADCGARAAGLEIAWGNEYDPAIAEVGNANLGGHIRVGDVLHEDPRRYERVDVLHMSPPCTRASVANNSAEVDESGLKEAPLDIALAHKCIEFVETLRPEIVTLENVWGYRLFQSWKGGRKCEGIQQALYRLGYWISVEHVNAADLGVPQTRKRMIVRAIRGGMVPYLPHPVPWVGWYASIEDILHTLPETQFAPWQLARLPDELRTMLVGNDRNGDARDRLNLSSESAPAFTITSSNGAKLRALIINGDNATRDCSIRNADEPIFTVTDGRKHPLKAFIVDCQNAGDPSPDRPRGLTIRDGDEPCFTLTSSMGQKRPTRAFTGSRVVAMTPRALARFQSFPDAYVLPEGKTLAAKGIGNAVCPLMYQKILEGMMT